MSSLCCRFCDIDVIMLSIVDCAQTNADQLDFHRALQLQSQEEQSEQNDATDENQEIARENRRRDAQLQFYHTNPHYKRASKIARMLLDQFSGNEGFSSSSSSVFLKNNQDGAAQEMSKPHRACKGLLDLSCVRHIMTIAACFCACKFQGTQDIMFVTLDSLVISLIENSERVENEKNNHHQPQYVTHRQKQYQDEIVLEKADPNKKINLFEDSDDDIARNNDNNSNNNNDPSQKPMPSSDDDLIVEKNKNQQNDQSSFFVDEHAKRDLLVECIIAAERQMLARCLYFAAFPLEL